MRIRCHWFLVSCVVFCSTKCVIFYNNLSWFYPLSTIFQKNVTYFPAPFLRGHHFICCLVSWNFVCFSFRKLELSSWQCSFTSTWFSITFGLGFLLKSVSIDNHDILRINRLSLYWACCIFSVLEVV